MVDWDNIWNDHSYYSVISNEKIREMANLLEDGILVMNFIKVYDVKDKVYRLLEEQFLNIKKSDANKNYAGNVLIDIVKAIKNEDIQSLCFDLSKKIFKKHGASHDLWLNSTNEEVTLDELKTRLSIAEYRH